MSDEILDDPGELLRLFIETPEGEADAFRMAHCRTCQEESDVQKRRALCHARRCILCEPEELAAERVWLAGIVSTTFPPNVIRAEALAAVNERVAYYGAAIPILTPDSDGNVRQLISFLTLRGALHAELIYCLRLICGDTIHLHANTPLTLAEIGKHIKRRRSFFKGWKARQLPLRAKVVGSERKAAADLGISRSTLRDQLARISPAKGNEKEGDEKEGNDEA